MIGAGQLIRTTQLLPQIVVISVIALGEEFGWRGYALPRLRERYSMWVSAIVVGVVWGLWHFPAYLIGTGVPADLNFGVFLVWVVAASVVIAFLMEKSQNVLIAILLHVMANVTFNYFFLLPEFVGTARVFSIFLSLLLLTIAIVTFYLRSRERSV